MLSNLSRLLLALGVASATTSALGSTSPPRPLLACTVTGAEKLPAGLGGASAICTAMTTAATQAAAHGLKVDVRVLGSSRLSATLSNSAGTVLAERRFATSDRSLTKSAIDRFARSLVSAAANKIHARAH